MKRLPSRLRLVVDHDEPLIAFVVRRGGVDEGLAREAIARGGAFVRGRRVRDAACPLRTGDRVEVSLQAPEVPRLSREHVLHLDANVLAIDKPAGVAAQEDLAGSPALPALCSELLHEMGERQAQTLLVHRLDRGTTGVTLLARTKRAQGALLGEFREHRVRKEYRALVAGALDADEGEVTAPIEAREARTRWRVVERFAEAAQIAAEPETGRTHQIRIHLRAIGHPLLGDKAYGGPAFLTRPEGARHDFARPMLHALSLSLRHPDGGRLEVLAPLPPDFDSARAFLRG